MERRSLDSYGMYPPEMLTYMQNYGKHFSKRMYEFAVSKMYKRNPDGSKMRFSPISKEAFNNFMSAQGIQLENDMLYDGCYVYSMAEADFKGSSIEDERHWALYVKDLIDDPDAADGQVFNRFYADCMLHGIPIDWENML